MKSGFDLICRLCLERAVRNKASDTTAGTMLTYPRLPNWAIDYPQKYYYYPHKTWLLPPLNSLLYSHYPQITCAKLKIFIWRKRRRRGQHVCMDGHFRQDAAGRRFEPRNSATSSAKQLSHSVASSYSRRRRKRPSYYSRLIVCCHNNMLRLIPGPLVGSRPLTLISAYLDD